MTVSHMPISKFSPPVPERRSAADGLAFKLYLLFMVSWFLHLPERAPVLALFRLDLVLVVIVAVLIGAGRGSDVEHFDSRIKRLILLLIAYAIITVPFVQWPGTVVKSGLPELLKALVFYYFTARLTTSERRLSQLLFVFVSCQAFRVLEPLYLHVTQGYWGSVAYMEGGKFLDRLSGAPSDVVNPNGLAVVILCIIPFVHYLWTRTRVGALAYLVLLSLLLYALVLTGSRSGLLGLATTFLALWLQSRRKLLLATVAAVVVVTVVPRLPPDLVDRYASIFDSDTKNAATAEGRLEGAKADFAVAMRRPLLGHGLGTTTEANFHFNGYAQPSHNLYLEVLEELGFVGLLIFVLLLG
ncbi:MAG: O-antigen ligase family protein, partial [Acidimicrobiia bacterium]